MNWYHFLKIAQIWKVNTDGSFDNDIHAFYELEFKYNAVKNNTFHGHPRRRQNILNNLEDQLEKIISRIIPPIISTFENWLSRHAILSPRNWAEARYRDAEYGDAEEFSPINEALYEYVRYINENQFVRDEKVYKNLSPIIQQISDNIDQFPAFQRLYDILLDEYIEMERENREYMDDDYNESEEEWEQRMQELSLEDILEGSNDIDSFNLILNNTGLDKEAAIEIWQNIVFPLWYQYWQQQGIDETREANEYIYNMLKNINNENINYASAVISLALNAVHQNGSMLDYMEDPSYSNTDVGDLRQTFELMTQGTYVDEWIQELREIGVQI